MARWATSDLRPHLTVLLDLPPQTGLTRFEERDRIEGESVEFHERVRQAFLRLASAHPEHYVVIDARRPIEEIAAVVRERVEPLLEQAVRGPAPVRPRRPRRTRPPPTRTRGPRPVPRRPRRERGGGVVTTSPARVSGPRGTGSVWDGLVGQSAAIETLRRAVAGQGMTHAWLFTGPRLGRSNAALAFAAALQCEQGGCGHCLACTTALAGSHADVSVTRTDQAVIKVGGMRELVLRSALAPVGHRWQVMVVEDADRLNDSSGNALLKAIEEPSAHRVAALRAHGRGRAAHPLPLPQRRARHPSTADVADFLVRRNGVPDGIAAFAARAARATSAAPARWHWTRRPGTGGTRWSRSRPG